MQRADGSRQGPDEGAAAADRAGRGRGRAGLVATALLAVLAALAVLLVQPPDPAPADAPATAFSATRAAGHDTRIASTPHPVGSAADDAVRGYLVDTLRGMGLAPRVQDAVGRWSATPGQVVLARVRNVVTRIPGSDPTGTVFLVAHYDSVPVAPGGSDDAAGVSALLEATRALLAGPRPRNDVVLVLTEGEEACLCGAEAFASLDPLARAGGVVVNLEARGVSGPPVMFQTSRGNAGLAALFAQAAPQPVATSFAVEVYRRLPNDTDFSVFLDAQRFTGLNSAWIDGWPAYHTPQDTPERMDRGSLQALGEDVLGVTRALGARDLGNLTRRGGQDATYFPVLGRLVHYPGWLVWPLAIAAVLATLVAALVARGRGLTSWPRVLAGLAVSLLGLVLAALAAQLLWRVAVHLRPGYAGMGDPWRPGWYRLAVVAVALAVLLGWQALWRRVLRPASLAAGALLLLATLAVVLAGLAPGGSYLAALPALAGALGQLVVSFVRSPVAAAAVLTATSAVAVVVLVPAVALFFPALGLAAAAAPAVFVALLGLALLPVLDLLLPDPRREAPRRPVRAAVPALALLLVTVACTGIGLAVDRFDAAHPRPSQLMYGLDLDAGRAWWLSAEASPGPWTRQFVDSRGRVDAAFPVLAAGQQLWSGQAPLAPLRPSTVRVVSDRITSAGRRLVVHVTPQRQVDSVLVRVPGAAQVRAATVAGRDVSSDQLGSGDLTLVLYAPPAGGFDVDLVMAATQPVDLLVEDQSTGLADLPGFVPRPPDVGVGGGHRADLVAVASTAQVG